MNAGGKDRFDVCSSRPGVGCNPGSAGELTEKSSPTAKDANPDGTGSFVYSGGAREKAVSTGSADAGLGRRAAMFGPDAKAILVAQIATPEIEFVEMGAARAKVDSNERVIVIAADPGIANFKARVREVKDANPSHSVVVVDITPGSGSRTLRNFLKIPAQQVESGIAKGFEAWRFHRGVLSSAMTIAGGVEIVSKDEARARISAEPETLVLYADSKSADFEALVKQTEASFPRISIVAVDREDVSNQRTLEGFLKIPRNFVEETRAFGNQAFFFKGGAFAGGIRNLRGMLVADFAAARMCAISALAEGKKVRVAAIDPKKSNDVEMARRYGSMDTLTIIVDISSVNYDRTMARSLKIGSSDSDEAAKKGFGIFDITMSGADLVAMKVEEAPVAKKEPTPKPGQGAKEKKVKPGKAAKAGKGTPAAAPAAEPAEKKVAPAAPQVVSTAPVAPAAKKKADDLVISGAPDKGAIAISAGSSRVNDMLTVSCDGAPATIKSSGKALLVVANPSDKRLPEISEGLKKSHPGFDRFQMSNESVLKRSRALEGAGVTTSGDLDKAETIGIYAFENGKYVGMVSAEAGVGPREALAVPEVAKPAPEAPKVAVAVPAKPEVAPPAPEKKAGPAKADPRLEKRKQKADELLATPAVKEIANAKINVITEFNFAELMDPESLKMGPVILVVGDPNVPARAMLVGQLVKDATEAGIKHRVGWVPYAAGRDATRILVNVDPKLKAPAKGTLGIYIVEKDGKVKPYRPASFVDIENSGQMKTLVLNPPDRVLVVVGPKADSPETVSTVKLKNEYRDAKRDGGLNVDGKEIASLGFIDMNKLAGIDEALNESFQKGGKYPQAFIYEGKGRARKPKPVQLPSSIKTVKTAMTFDESAAEEKTSAPEKKAPASEPVKETKPEQRAEPAVAKAAPKADDKAAKEKAEKEAADKAAKEKTDRDAAEKAAKGKAEGEAGALKSRIRTAALTRKESLEALKRAVVVPADAQTLIKDNTKIYVTNSISDAELIAAANVGYGEAVVIDWQEARGRELATTLGLPPLIPGERYHAWDYYVSSGTFKDGNPLDPKESGTVTQWFPMKDLLKLRMAGPDGYGFQYVGEVKTEVDGKEYAYSNFDEVFGQEGVNEAIVVAGDVRFADAHFLLEQLAEEKAVAAARDATKPDATRPQVLIPNALDFDASKTLARLGIRRSRKLLDMGVYLAKRGKNGKWTASLYNPKGARNILSGKDFLESIFNVNGSTLVIVGAREGSGAAETTNLRRGVVEAGIDGKLTAPVTYQVKDVKSGKITRSGTDRKKVDRVVFVAESDLDRIFKEDKKKQFLETVRAAGEMPQAYRFSGPGMKKSIEVVAIDGLPGGPVRKNKSDPAASPKEYPQNGKTEAGKTPPAQTPASSGEAPMQIGELGTAAASGKVAVAGSGLDTKTGETKLSEKDWSLNVRRIVGLKETEKVFEDMRAAENASILSAWLVYGNEKKQPQVLNWLKALSKAKDANKIGVFTPIWLIDTYDPSPQGAFNDITPLADISEKKFDNGNVIIRRKDGKFAAPSVFNCTREHREKTWMCKPAEPPKVE